ARATLRDPSASPYAGTPPGRPWGCSSAGRAPRSHRGGQGFESPHLHHFPGFERYRSAMAATRPPTRIVLVGMMGSGKTTVGREIARRTGWPWLDNDDLVRELTGREPSAIAIEDGEEAPHDAEAASLGAALGRDPPLVVAAAGSTVERPDVR